MSELCSCSSLFGNTGRPNCEALLKVINKVVIVPYYNSSNVTTHILKTTTLDQQYFLDWYNNDAKQDRAYPLGGLKNVVLDKSDTQFIEYDDQSKSRVSEGVRSFSAFIDQTTAVLIGKLIQSGCSDLGFFMQDVNDNLAGNGSLTDRLKCFKLKKGSLDAILQFASNAPQEEGIMISFDFDKTEKDADIRVITSQSYDADVDFEVKALQGILDITATTSNVIATAVDVKLTFEYGDFFNLEPFISGVLADFTLFNNTTLLAVVISAVDVTDAANGNYTGITYAAQTAADSLTLSINPSDKNGFELDVDFVAV